MRSNSKLESEIGFEFVPNVAGESNGLNDAGIETYKSNPIASLARECGQNSNDAAIKKPVVVDFDLIEQQAQYIPGLNQLKAAIDACFGAATGRKDEKATEFFAQARKVIGGGSIKIMRVADSNTKGLMGPCEPGTPFHALLKAAGESNKGDNVTSGGSFGIGKNAAFAVSDLRTVFYSTLYRLPNGDKNYFLAQGKAKLTSHMDAAGNPKLATGYWGRRGDFMPVEGQESVPEWLRRSQIGTSVFALGFRDSPNWQYEITYSLLVNFFAAIHRGQLQFNINGGAISINANSISALFNDERVIAAAEEDNRLEDLEFAQELFSCLTSPETVEKIVTLRGLGQISIRVRVKEGLRKRVGVIRNGMMITDSLKHFGERLDRFPLYNEFVALVEPLDAEGSALIKRLESPRHDELSADYIPDPAKAEAARTAIKALAKRVRETIRNETKIQHDDEVPIDEMSEFFAQQGPANLPPDAVGEQDPERIRYELRVSPVVRRSIKPAKSAIGGGGTPDGKPNTSRGGSSSGGKLGGGSGSSGVSEAIPIGLRDLRAAAVPNGGAEKRQLHFTPTIDGEATISIEASGLNAPETLAIVKADQGNIANGKLRIALTAGTRTSVSVEFLEPYDGPVEVSAMAHGS